MKRGHASEPAAQQPPQLAHQVLAQRPLLLRLCDLLVPLNCFWLEDSAYTTSLCGNLHYEEVAVGMRAMQALLMTCRFLYRTANYWAAVEAQPSHRRWSEGSPETRYDMALARQFAWTETLRQLLLHEATRCLRCVAALCATCHRYGESTSCDECGARLCTACEMAGRREAYHWLMECRHCGNAYCCTDCFSCGDVASVRGVGKFLCSHCRSMGTRSSSTSSSSPSSDEDDDEEEDGEEESTA